MIALILAMADNGVIGHANGLPWHISADMRHFKRITMGKPLVMGRKTFESIGKPLPGRANIVISRQAGYRPEGVSVVASVSEALRLAETMAETSDQDEVMVIGGAQVYQECLRHADRIYLTEVHAAPEGDTAMPLFNRDRWREVAREDYRADQDSEPDYSFVTLERTG